MKARPYKVRKWTAFRAMMCSHLNTNRFFILGPQNEIVCDNFINQADAIAKCATFNREQSKGETQ